jgi:hypothetical protein
MMEFVGSYAAVHRGERVLLLRDQHALPEKHAEDLAKSCWGLDGPYIEPEAKWRARHVTEYSVVEHDLQVNAWVLTYRRLVGENLIDWFGPDQGRIEVAATYEPQKRRFRPVDLQDATLASDGHHHPRGLRLDHFGPLFPDATLTLYCDSIGAEVDLLVELDRTRRATKNLDKLRRYDAFLTAWCRMTDRYRYAAEPPCVIFVFRPRADALRRRGGRPRRVSAGLVAAAASRRRAGDGRLLGRRRRASSPDPCAAGNQRSVESGTSPPEPLKYELQLLQTYAASMEPVVVEETFPPMSPDPNLEKIFILDSRSYATGWLGAWGDNTLSQEIASGARPMAGVWGKMFQRLTGTLSPCGSPCGGYQP